MSLPLIVFIIGIAGLFFLNREKSARASAAVWLPAIWFSLNGSRSIMSWLGKGSEADSPVDEGVACILLVLAIITLIRRKSAGRSVKLDWAIILYFSYCLVSTMWSDFPAHAFQRWIKSLGDVVMAMVLVTDAQPSEALRHFFSRAGFVLLPMSVLLERYYPALGRGYTIDGLEIVTGVTNNKNSLGVLTFVIGLAALWQVIDLLKTKEKRPGFGRRLLAQGVLLCFACTLLIDARSATSGACFVLGAIFMVVTALPFFSRRPRLAQALVIAILLAGGATVFLGGAEAAAHVAGRENLSGRTWIWSFLIPANPNAAVGAGFESFWFGPRLTQLRLISSNINEAHNGYVEVFLNLGLIGIFLLVLLLVQGFRKSLRAFRQDASLGSLLVAFVLTATVYGYTEAGFRMLDPIWFCLLLALIMATRILAVSAKETSSAHLRLDAAGARGRFNPAGSFSPADNRVAPKRARVILTK